MVMVDPVYPDPSSRKQFPNLTQHGKAETSATGIWSDLPKGKPYKLFLGQSGVKSAGRNIAEYRQNGMVFSSEQKIVRSIIAPMLPIKQPPVGSKNVTPSPVFVYEGG